MARATTKLGKNAKEESFWSSFSRKGPNAGRADFAAENLRPKQTMPRIKARGQASR